MIDVDDWTQWIIVFILLIFAKVVLLQYTLKLARWWKTRGKKVSKKCRNIYDYNFLDEYDSNASESETDGGPQPDPDGDSTGSKSKRNFAGKHSAGDSRSYTSNLQLAAKKLLTTIRNRRERTAAALLNVSTLSNEETETSESNTNNYKCQNAKEFLESSEYYAFLQNILQEENDENQKHE